VCREKFYQYLKADHQAVHGRLTWPPVPYRLVIAACRDEDNKNDRVVARSGESYEKWDSRNKVYEFHTVISDPYRTEHQDDIDAISNALESLVELLFEHSDAMSVSDITKKLCIRDERYVSLALQAADIWKMIDVTRSGVRVKIDLKDPSSKLVELTDVGQAWHMASSSYQDTLTRKRRTVSERRRKTVSIKFTGPITAGTFNNVASGDISDQINYSEQHAAISDRQLLDCFTELLDSRRIPWHNPELADVRLVLEDAVAQENPRVSGMNRAIAKLKDSCGDVLKGMISIGAYALLMGYFK
jgi:hypothetical protein